MSFDFEGMHFESEAARGDYKWSAFYRIAEGAKVFIFMQTTRSGTYIPKRCFKPGDVFVLRQLIRENFTGKVFLRGD